MSSRSFGLAIILLLPAQSLAQTSFLDLNATGNTFGATAGTGAGSVFIRGSLAGNGVTIRIVSNAATNPLALNDPTFASNWGASTVNGTSVQYNHPEAYSPAATNIDRVGFSKPASAAATTAQVSITFDSPVAANTLRFHVANLDQTRFDFTPSVAAGLTGLAVRSGNAGDGTDGLGIGGTGNLSIIDINAATRNTGTTQDATYTGLLPTTGDIRSAYGTVDLLSVATLQTITFNTTTFNTAAGTDSGSFTVSFTPVPEPATVLGVAAVGLVGWLRLRRR